MKGQRKHPLYNTWIKMKARCCNPNTINYHRYGGRGIRVCNSWMNSFDKFVKDMGNRPSYRHTLDRIDNDGNYSKRNCKWSLPDEQTYNQGVRTDNKTGYKGISYNKRHKRWYVYLGWKDGKRNILSSKYLNELISIRDNYINSLNAHIYVFKNQKVL
jgi:hypothetical protein